MRKISIHYQDILSFRRFYSFYYSRNKTSLVSPMDNFNQTGLVIINFKMELLLKWYIIYTDVIIDIVFNYFAGSIRRIVIDYYNFCNNIGWKIALYCFYQFQNIFRFIISRYYNR